MNETAQQNMENHPVIRTLYDHVDEVTCLAFHPTEQILASGSRDYTLKLFDYSKPSAKRAFKYIQVRDQRSLDFYLDTVFYGYFLRFRYFVTFSGGLNDHPIKDKPWVPLSQTPGVWVTAVLCPGRTTAGPGGLAQVHDQPAHSQFLANLNYSVRPCLRSGVRDGSLLLRCGFELQDWEKTKTSL